MLQLGRGGGDLPPNTCYNPPKGNSQSLLAHLLCKMAAGKGQVSGRHSLEAVYRTLTF